MKNKKAFDDLVDELINEWQDNICVVYKKDYNPHYITYFPGKKVSLYDFMAATCGVFNSENKLYAIIDNSNKKLYHKGHFRLDHKNRKVIFGKEEDFKPSSPEQWKEPVGRQRPDEVAWGRA